MLADEFLPLIFTIKGGIMLTHFVILAEASIMKDAR